MFAVNEYFEGNVKSLSFNPGEEKATVGVMAVGEYEFGTNCVEHMTLVTGAMAVILPGEKNWKEIEVGETFVVEANVKFKVKIEVECAYLCLYK